MHSIGIRMVCVRPALNKRKPIFEHVYALQHHLVNGKQQLFENRKCISTRRILSNIHINSDTIVRISCLILVIKKLPIFRRKKRRKWFWITFWLNRRQASSNSSSSSQQQQKILLFELHALMNRPDITDRVTYNIIYWVVAIWLVYSTKKLALYEQSTLHSLTIQWTNLNKSLRCTCECSNVLSVP